MLTDQQKKLAVIKMEDGDALSDEELDAMIELYQQLDEGLGLLGREYKLARYPIMLKLQDMEAWKAHRSEKNMW